MPYVGLRKEGFEVFLKVRSRVKEGVKLYALTFHSRQPSQNLLGFNGFDGG